LKEISISVVVPCLNCSAYVKQALSSVIAQESPVHEIIMVDDGSSDNSAEIAFELLSENDIPFRIIKQANAGLGAARNRGFEEAEGEWVALLDSDDVWFPEKIKRIKEVLNSSNKKADVLYHSTRAIGGGRDRICRPVWGIDDILARGNAPVPSATVIRVEALQQLKGFSESRKHLGAEDLHLWIRMLRADMRFESLREFLGSYRYGGMSSILDEHMTKVDSVLKDLHRVGYITDEHLRQARDRKQYEAGRSLHKDGLFKEAMKHYDKVPLDFKALVFRVLALLKVKM
jgi:glycosyltransferase involved in cell wall biosynthesis